MRTTARHHPEAITALTREPGRPEMNDGATRAEFGGLRDLVKTAMTRAFALVIWCRRGDLNPHAHK